MNSVSIFLKTASCFFLLFSFFSNANSIQSVPESPNIFNEKSLYLKIPLMFKDYNKLLDNEPTANYIYPGSFYISSNGKIYIQYVFDPKTTNNVIVVYSAKGVYEGYYLISNGGQGVAGEGLIVKKNKDNEMTVYAGSTNGVMKAYILSHAKYGDLLKMYQSYAIGLYNQFTFYNKKWLVESIDRSDNVTSRTNLIYLDLDFNPLNKISLELQDSGYITDKTTRDAKKYNKRQGLGLCGDFLVAGYGAYYSKVVHDTTNTYQGIKLFDTNGNKLSQFMYNPKILISSFSNMGLKATRVENEGVTCSSDGRNLFSIFIYSDRKHPSIAKNEGIVIFKSSMQDLINKFN
ncbi:hypothetical protein J1779_06700 [Rahnella sp. FC061912-K]|uniref:hypothetical protein n=1 Tax=Rahnella rivi TaxID=2816249 RepID=UPI001C2590F1|nr:hypothetical protein [Rahnella rivi]MBU9829619.1 hypothetical protein [Rahnella rivi]